MQMAATWGQDGSAGSGRRPFAHSPRTLPGVSAPSSVVRSMQRMARSIARALDEVFTDLEARVAARASAPTWSTPGRPCTNRRRAASLEVTESSGVGGVAAGAAGSDVAVALTCGVYASHA